LFGRGGTVFCDKRAGRSQNHGNDGGVQPPVAHVKGRAVEELYREEEGIKAKPIISLQSLSG